jgi:predicted Fe-Mo cluster-binding NifX family protein
MKIAVSATGGSMNAGVSEEFGRCAYFLIVDSDTMRFEPISNPGIGMAGGAGPASAREISARGAKVVLTGKVGPKARAALDSACITIVGGLSGAKSVKEAVEQYLKGQNQ